MQFISLNCVLFGFYLFWFVWGFVCLCVWVFKFVFFWVFLLCNIMFFLSLLTNTVKTQRHNHEIPQMD